MFSVLYTVTEQEKQLAERITTCIAAEKIFVLGNTIANSRTITLFNTKQPSCQYTSHYYVLVLVQKTDEHTLNGIQDKVENNLQRWIPVTTIVLSIHHFNGWLSEGHVFACTVLQRAMLLHDSGMPLITPKEINIKEWETNCQHYHAKGLMMITEFLAGAELYRLRSQHAMAAFMLHQATEHGLRCLLKITTGLRTNTHNLAKLIRYCSMTVHQLPEIFWGNANCNADRELFSRLQTAYIDARYKEYSLSAAELIRLEQKLKAFLDLYKTCKRLDFPPGSDFLPKA